MASFAPSLTSRRATQGFRPGIGGENPNSSGFRPGIGGDKPLFRPGIGGERPRFRPGISDKNPYRSGQRSLTPELLAQMARRRLGG